MSTAQTQVRSRPRPWTVIASGPFRNLWVATSLSLIGDFFSYVAIAWLVLQLTGSSLALGSVLVVQAVPRGVLMLVGGAISDRLSPRLAMLASMGLRVALVAPLAVLVLTGHVQMWEVYGTSFVFGVVDAFFLPARSSILPRLVDDHQLEAGNAVLNISSQVSVVVGPALAGLVVALAGTGWAFATDAACFALGALFVLWLPAANRIKAHQVSSEPGLGGQILAGFRYAWADVGIRSALIIIAAVDFAANGSLGVGLPTLAHGRFGASAAGFGIMLGAWGVGATAGALAAGMVRRQERMGWWLVAVCAWLGACVVAVGLIPTLLPAAITLGIGGVASGVINTFGISWLQRRTDPDMQGRVMSLVMLASMGLVPVAYALSGAIADVNPTVLFIAAGGLMLATAAAAAASRTVRSI
ncbi:MAG: MFS transporter [Candidatus Dormibacteraeota bacterium]|nr:MFS transporter [Candidatus Dormibacteraeota bacterium]